VTKPLLSWIYAALGAVVLTMSGCQSGSSTSPAVVIDGTEKQRRIASLQQRLSEIASFQVRGGLGFWTDREQGSASFSWRQVADELDIDVTAPLGLGQVRLQQRALGAMMQRGSTVRRAPSIDSLLATSLNLPIGVPVDQLSRWIRGLPGDAEKVKHDSDGRLASAIYSDPAGQRWFAQVLRYGEYAGMPVPRVITAKSGDINLRVTLKNWSTVADQAPQSDTLNTPQPAPQSKPSRLRIPGR